MVKAAAAQEGGLRPTSAQGLVRSGAAQPDRMEPPWRLPQLRLSGMVLLR